MNKILGIMFALVCYSQVAVADGLTSGSVQGWLDSQSAVESFGKQYEGKLKPFDADIENQGTPMEAFQQGIVALKGTGLYGQFENIIDDYGFDSPEQWAEVGGRIMSAYLAIEMGDRGPEMEQMMQQMETMMNNPNIPAEQKQMMQNSMKQSAAVFESAKNAPEGDKRVVKSFLPQLKAMTGSEMQP